MNTPGLKDAVDDAEAAMKLHHAFVAGRNAGMVGLTVNPHPSGSPEALEWDRGRSITKEAA